MVNFIFATIGITSTAMHTAIINQDGFTHLKHLATLISDKDKDEMAKWMAASRTQAEGHVILGTVTIQHFKVLVWWVMD